jgi:single-strand DNA-binding protein
MPFDLNKILLIGHVGADPEMQFTSGGSPVTRFRLAVNRSRGGAGGEAGERPQEETEWFTVVAWNKLAETCNQFVGKGQRVFVEGRLETRTWEGRDGQKRLDLRVVASNVLFLDRRTSAYGEGDGPAAGGDDIDPEDLPF